MVENKMDFLFQVATFNFIQRVLRSALSCVVILLGSVIIAAQLILQRNRARPSAAATADVKEDVAEPSSLLSVGQSLQGRVSVLHKKRQQVREHALIASEISNSSELDFTGHGGRIGVGHHFQSAGNSHSSILLFHSQLQMARHHQSISHRQRLRQFCYTFCDEKRFSREFATFTRKQHVLLPLGRRTLRQRIDSSSV